MLVLVRVIRKVMTKDENHDGHGENESNGGGGEAAEWWRAQCDCDTMTALG